jgi:hypothetical protein
MISPNQLKLQLVIAAQLIHMLKAPRSPIPPIYLDLGGAIQLVVEAENIYVEY